MNASRELRHTEERLQSRSRIGISLGTFAILIVSNLVRHVEFTQHIMLGLSVILTHSTFSLFWHRFIHRKPDAWPNRIYVSMALDITTTALAFCLANSRSAQFIEPIHPNQRHELKGIAIWGER